MENGSGRTAASCFKEARARFEQVPDALFNELFSLLVRERCLVKINEDLYYAGAVLAGLEEKIRAHLKAHGEIDAQGFKAMTGLTRKFSIPLLEHFDQVKLTLRVGDKRILRERQE